MQEYVAFSKKMDLPTQKERIYQDGLKVNMRVAKKARESDLHAEKLRKREYGTVPDYARNEAIDICKDTDGIRNLFPEIKILKGFDKLSLDIQKEIAQGLGFMRERFGEKSVPVTFNASDLGDKTYGKTKLRQRKVMINRTTGYGDAFTAACHESMHVYDYNRGLISEKLLPDAFRDLGIAPDSKDADTLVLDLLGWKLYNEYRYDSYFAV